MKTERIKEIKSTYRIEDVIESNISGGLKRQGTQMAGFCPWHNDNTRSLMVSPTKQIFKCYVAGCGVGGDMFDFFEKQGKTKEEAADIITGGSIVKLPEIQRAPPPPKLTDAVPPQDRLPDMEKLYCKFTNQNTGEVIKDYGHPAAVWAYHDENGRVTGYVCRFNLPDGKKDVLPYFYKNNGQRSFWTWRGPNTPRPLYNLHELKKHPDAIVLLVEGEKTADAAANLFPQFVVSTWIGGSENVHNTDWTPLHGRNVYLWPDNDLAGIFAMFGGWAWMDQRNEYKRMKGIAEIVPANFKRIQNRKEFPAKWDVADATWTPTEAADYLKENRTEIPKISELPPNEKPAPVKPPVEEIPVPEISKPIPAPVAPVLRESTQQRNPHFRCIGFENTDDRQNVFAFYVYRTNVIVKMKAGGITTSNILQLAPLNYWEGTYPKQSRSSGGVKFEMNMIVDSLISQCMNAGMFDASKIRGRGAWIDKGVPVIHCGDHLIVDGKPIDFGQFQTRHIYEAGKELGLELVEPLQKAQAYGLIQIMKRLNWARDINAYLLCGWIVVAPLCGALPWRPHIWLTGPSGAGKSWVMKMLINRLLGNMVMKVHGNTTEAGIRQLLKADALPVTFDEAEAEDRKGVERNQAILETIRTSSDSNDAKIVKGGSNGLASQFDLNSCFAFSSIGAYLSQRADISRITLLELKMDETPEKKTKWEETLMTYFATITDEYVAAFLSRSIRLLPVILKNAKTFANAAAAELDNQRAGDQLGALLAGAYSLTSGKVISLEDARQWIRERDWSEERLQDSTRDEIKVLHKIMNAEVRVETLDGQRVRTVGELVIIARGDVVDRADAMIISEELANASLKRVGIKVERYNVMFADNSDFISKVLASTAYSKSFASILSRVNGATKKDRTTFAHLRSRATVIDSRVIFGADYEDPGSSQTELNLHK